MKTIFERKSFISSFKRRSKLIVFQKYLISLIVCGIFTRRHCKSFLKAFRLFSLSIHSIYLTKDTPLVKPKSKKLSLLPTLQNTPNSLKKTITVLWSWTEDFNAREKTKETYCSLLEVLNPPLSRFFCFFCV